MQTQDCDAFKTKLASEYGVSPTPTDRRECIKKFSNHLIQVHLITSSVLGLKQLQ